MTEHVWDKFLTERDKAVFGTSGYGARQGFGKRPALVIIDVNYAFCDERPMPILESIKRWRNSCGEDAWVAMPYLKSLIDKAHEKGIPVIYTTGVRREDNWDNGSWGWKNSRGEEDRSTLGELIGRRRLPPAYPRPVGEPRRASRVLRPRRSAASGSASGFAAGPRLGSFNRSKPAWSAEVPRKCR